MEGGDRDVEKYFEVLDDGGGGVDAVDGVHTFVGEGGGGGGGGVEVGLGDELSPPEPKFHSP